MVDYLKTNWTQKIKTNPVANMILNGKKVAPRRMIEIGKVHKLSRTGRLTIDDLIENSTMKRKLTLLEYDHLNEEEKKEMDDIMYADDFLDEENKKKDRRALRKRKRRRRVRYQKQQQQQIQKFQQQQQQQPQAINQQNDNNNDAAIAAQKAQADIRYPVLKRSVREEVLEPDVAVENRNRFTGVGVGGVVPSVIPDTGVGENRNSSGAALGNGIVISSDDDSDYAEYDDLYLHFEGGEEGGSSGMWDNTYVKDFIHIHLPKQRVCHVSALSNAPLQVKPTSVFFSDV